MSKASPREVANALRRRRKTCTVYALKAADGRFYFDFVDFIVRQALDELYVYAEEEQARKMQRLEKGSRVVPVKITIDIEEVDERRNRGRT
jgi:hypothetical protein